MSSSSHSSLARRYAKALVMALHSEKEYREIKGELEEFLKLLDGSPDLKAGMETLLFSKQQKREVLESLHREVKFNPKTFNFLLALIEENRMMFLDAVIPQVEELWFEKEGIQKLKVFSAVELDETLEKKLKKNLEKSFGKKVVLEKGIDESLIAGIKIQKGSIFYDFSIQGNLKKLKEALAADSAGPGLA